jgi:hypothetical protein
MGTGSFKGVERPGCEANHPTPSTAKVKERVELYLYSPLGRRPVEESLYLDKRKAAGSAKMMVLIYRPVLHHITNYSNSNIRSPHENQNCEVGIELRKPFVILFKNAIRAITKIRRW